MQLFEVSYIVVMFNIYNEYSPNSPFVACNDINLKSNSKPLNCF